MSVVVARDVLDHKNMTPGLIRISEPSAGARSVSVDKAYLTVGAEPTCDIILAAGSAAGFEGAIVFSDGAASFFNRTGHDITVNGKTVAGGTSVPWPFGTSVRIADEVELELTHARAPSSADVDAPPEVLKPRPEKPSAQDNRIKLGVIAVCLVAIIGIPVSQHFQSTSSPVASVKLRTVVDAAPAAKEPEEVELRLALTRRAQAAEFALLRGDVASARVRFDRLKKFLSGRTTDQVGQPLAAEWAQFSEQMLHYVDGRLSAISQLK